MEEARRGRPRKIQPDEIVAVATQLIERDGLARFTMRALAEMMNVRPMAFYTHFDNKEALLDAVADAFLRTVELPTQEGARWDRYVVGVGEALRDAWTAHPHLLAVLMARPGRGTAIAHVVGTFLETLVDAGLTPELAHSAWHAVQSLVFGEVYQHATWGPGPRGGGGVPERAAATTTAGPLLTRALARCEPAVEFRVGLELIVAGLRAHRDAPPLGQEAS